MFLFGKKKKKEELVEEDELEITEQSEEEEDIELDVDDEVETISDEEILESLAEDDETDEDGEDDDDDEEDESAQTHDVTVTPTTFDELADIVSAKKTGAVQYMKKETGEVFALREYHFRYAGIWGVVSMGREVSPHEYARITLAAEVLEDRDAFHILPYLSDEELYETVCSFCDERYGINGKKYAKNADKFAALINEKDDLEEWKMYFKAAIVVKLAEFCEEKGIEFSEEEESDE